MKTKNFVIELFIILFVFLFILGLSMFLGYYVAVLKFIIYGGSVYNNPILDSKEFTLTGIGVGSLISIILFILYQQIRRKLESIK